MTDLIDTTEMYLRTVYELEEEGIVPLRARIAERIGHSGPTVSQTVARMQRDGLVVVSGDRHLELTARGRERATKVMRKHRLAERLLTDVIGLDWAEVHDEACRWEHVMSEAVERRLVDVLGAPVLSPYGGPIPALAELGVDAEPPAFLEGVAALPDAFADTGPDTGPDAGEAGGGARVEIARLGESLQTDPALLARLARAGALPGATLAAAPAPGGAWVLGAAGAAARLEASDARHVYVVARS
jgi:DtxR family Mn-dependent transcriptional regulator